MKKMTRLALLLGSTLLCLSTVHANVPNTDFPTTFLGPNLKLGYASDFTDTTVYAVAGEAGLKNFRLGGTVGWRIKDNQRFKISAEYLWQNITYSFFSGNSDQWVQQGAMGADYRYDLLNYRNNPQLGLNAYASHALSKTLNPVTGIFIDNLGITRDFIDMRRIAGSNAAGMSPYITVEPWRGGKATVELNYDHVRYDKQNPNNEDAMGLGGTLRVTHNVSKDLAVGASAAIREPFNNYAANIAWSNVPHFGRWVLGADADYTAGKNTLPSTYNVSLSANYAVDPPPATTPAERVAAVDELIAWVGKPAVYMPQVLAIIDQSIPITTPSCPFGGVSFTGSIPNLLYNDSIPFTINTAGNFTGQNLTYSMAIAPPGLFVGDSLSIDSRTGIISGLLIRSEDYSVVVTATSPCGSASSNAISILNND